MSPLCPLHVPPASPPIPSCPPTSPCSVPHPLGASAAHRRSLCPVAEATTHTQWCVPSGQSWPAVHGLRAGPLSHPRPVPVGLWLPVKSSVWVFDDCPGQGTEISKDAPPPRPRSSCPCQTGFRDILPDPLLQHKDFFPPWGPPPPPAPGPCTALGSPPYELRSSNIFWASVVCTHCLDLSQDPLWTLRHISPSCLLASQTAPSFGMPLAV